MTKIFYRTQTGKEESPLSSTRSYFCNKGGNPYEKLVFLKNATKEVSNSIKSERKNISLALEGLGGAIKALKAIERKDWRKVNKWAFL